MPWQPEDILTEFEHQYLRQLLDNWEQTKSSVSYCTLRAGRWPKKPSDAASGEATVLVTEQLRVRTQTAGLSQHSNDKIGQLERMEVERNERALQFMENSFVEHYAWEVYQAHVFFFWHIGRFSRRIPERIPTSSERIRFERQFYTIWRFVVLPEPNLEEVVASYSLADLVRFGNLLKFFTTHSHVNHKPLEDVFRTSRGDDVLQRLETVRDAKAQTLLGLPSGYFQTAEGYTIDDTWSIYDEMQDQIDYQSPGDPNNRPPLPERIY